MEGVNESTQDAGLAPASHAASTNGTGRAAAGAAGGVQSIARAIDHVTPPEACGFFRHCGYHSPAQRL